MSRLIDAENLINELKFLYDSSGYIKNHESRLVMTTIMEQPTINPSKWISASERFPTREECQKNDCRFIVTDGNRVYQQYFDYPDERFGSYEHDDYFELIKFHEDNCVLKWMNMPEI